MTTRRALITGAAACTISIPTVGRGQSVSRIARVGILTFGTAEVAGPLIASFQRRMRQLGHVEGTNVRYEIRYGMGNAERLPPLATELAALPVDIIVVTNTPGARAALGATTTIPVVGIVLDPVASGFAKSLARPGGNFTGLSNFSADTSSKLIEMLVAIQPRASRIAVLTNEQNAGHPAVLRNLEMAAQRIGITLLITEAHTVAGITDAFSRMSREKIKAVIVPVDALFFLHRQPIAALALKHQVATAFSFREQVDAGGLMCYGHNNADQYAHAAVYVDKILKGASPAELPIEQATAFELVINMKTAKALGLVIPPALLLQANEVIQ